MNKSVARCEGKLVPGASLRDTESVPLNEKR